jgi:hypothetical protein
MTTAISDLGQIDTTAISAALFSQSTSLGVTCSTPLELLAHVVGIAEINGSLKYEAGRAIDFLREYLVIREKRGLEYIFAHALFYSCLAPAAGNESIYAVLERKFRALDRRRQDVTISKKSLPIVARETPMRRFILSDANRVALIRAFHIAEAIDADGPWTQTPEKDDMTALLIRVLTGYRSSLTM